MNDDNADVKLWNIYDADDSYGYDVKFLSYSTTEGGNFQYAVRLDAEPLAPVRIEPNITLRNGERVISPPILSKEPEYLMFGPANWSVHQRFVYSSIPDFIDNDAEVFEITHHVATDDNVFRQKATQRGMLTIVNVADDDTAQVLIKSNEILTLEKGDEAKSIELIGLATEPIFDVGIVVVTPSPFIKAIHRPISIAKTEWNNFSQTVQFQALNGAPIGTAKIYLLPTSLDPKYNTSDSGVTINIVVTRNEGFAI